MGQGSIGRLDRILLVWRKDRLSPEAHLEHVRKLTPLELLALQGQGMKVYARE